MAALLTQYKNLQEQLNEKIAENNLHPNMLIYAQEINYRISVIETFRMFYKCAPVTTDKNEMGHHFQLVDLYVQAVAKERKLGIKADEEMAKKRQTATEMFIQVINENRKQFMSFVTNSEQQYKNSISQYIETVLCAWIQYRNTFINVDL